MNKRYKVVIAQSAKRDVMEKKNYILQKFRYREYANAYSEKIRKAALSLEVFPGGYPTSGFQYRGYMIYMKSESNHLLFYTINENKNTVTILRILQDGMDWENIINLWITSN